MTISFGSTYRFPLTQAGIKPSKKDAVRTFLQKYPNHRVSGSNTGTARVSVPEELNDEIESNLRRMGFKKFEKFPEHNVHKDLIDDYIKNALNKLDYVLKGKNKRIKKGQSNFNKRH